MRTNKTLVAGLIGAAMALSAPAAFAQARSADTKWYVGGHLGQSSGKCSISGGSCDENDTAWKILGGYQINRNFAVELGYADLGKMTATAGASSLDIETTAWDLVGVGSWPLANQFSIYGKLGFTRTETKAGSAKDNGTNLTFGLGVGYDFSRNLGIRGEWQRYRASTPATPAPIVITAGDFDIGVLSVGVVYKF